MCLCSSDCNSYYSYIKYNLSIKNLSYRFRAINTVATTATIPKILPITPPATGPAILGAVFCPA